MKVNLIKKDNYNLHVINVDNFRGCYFSLAFRSKFDPKKAVAFVLLTDVLTDASKNYPSPKYVYRHNDSNHILDLYGSYAKSGNVMQAYIICNYVDPKYINEKDYLDNTYKFIFDMISNPLVVDNKFDEKIFNVVKKRLITDLQSLSTDNNFISIHEGLKLYASDNSTSFHLYDMIDFIKNFTSEDLYNYYKELICDSSIDIFVTGSTDSKSIEKVVNKYYPFKNSAYKKYGEILVNKPRLIPKKVVKKSKYKQSTIVMIFNVNGMSIFEREFVMPFYLNIINSGGLTSKLYKSLREENSLCYNVSTSCFDRTNTLLVKSTLSVGNENKAIRLVKKCINDMKSRISNEEFMGAYYAYQRSLKGMVDSIGAINRLYTNSYYANFSSYEEKLTKFKKVDIDQINELAKKVKLNTIYVLKGDINERNED